jgi:hypothetical protein
MTRIYNEKQAARDRSSRLYLNQRFRSYSRRVERRMLIEQVAMSFLTAGLLYMII